MEIVWIISGFVFIVLGILGDFLPVLPGPILSGTGLWLLQLSEGFALSKSTLILATLLALGITVADYIIPIYLTKKAKSHPYATRGATLGIIAGFFVFPPLGIIIMPIVGAFIGELIGSSDIKKALKSGSSSFLGFLAGTFIKLLYSLWILGLAVMKIF